MRRALVRIVVGTEAENPVELTSHDWRTDFDVELPPGPTELQTWLTARDGTQKGAYFVEIERVP